MWYHALQVLLVLVAIVIALVIRYTLIDRQTDSSKLHRAYLLQTTPVKQLRQHAMRWTWLAVLFVAVSTLALCESDAPPAFYPYGRFSVAQTKAQVSAAPRATPIQHEVFGRFGVVKPEPQSQ